MPRKKEYQRRLNRPIIDIRHKTTTDIGKREYMREYMRRLRALERRRR